MSEPTVTMRFAEAARTIVRVCRANGYDAPAFRAPPRVPGTHRTLRRLPNLGRCIVSVTVRGRDFDDVLADMIEGAIATNQLDGALADRLRTQLWEATNP